ncbi:MAG TPA: hypothetical protein VHH73_13910 [Verrucomicrobiae bacterium]|nr:hypothetical protein [Verrucomicrobiae bacterium]
MKPGGLFFTWMLPLVWGVNAVLSSFFRAAEDLTTGIAFLPGLLIQMAFKISMGGSFDWASGNMTRLLLLGLGVMLVLGLAADWLHARRRFWAKSVAVFSGFGAGFVAWHFVRNVVEESFERAVSHMDFDRPGTMLAWLLFAAACGIYLGTLVTLAAAWMWPAKAKE